MSDNFHIAIIVRKVPQKPQLYSRSCYRCTIDVRENGVTMLSLFVKRRKGFICTCHYFSLSDINSTIAETQRMMILIFPFKKNSTFSGSRSSIFLKALLLVLNICLIRPLEHTRYSIKFCFVIVFDKRIWLECKDHSFHSKLKICSF